MTTQYRLVGRFVKDDEPHVVDWSPRWTKKDAERRMAEIQAREEKAKKRGEHNDGLVSTPYYSEYELVELRIEQRQVTNWA